MARVTFQVHYATQWGEELLCERRSPDGELPPGPPALLPMMHRGGGFWTVAWDDLAPGVRVEYRYACRGPAGGLRREPVFRQFSTAPHDEAVFDQWLPPDAPDAAYLRQAFAGVIFRPAAGRAAAPESPADGRVRITLRAPRVRGGHRLCLTGSVPELGAWDPARALVMEGGGYPVWKAALPARAAGAPFAFKFGLWSDRERRLVTLEEGSDRWFGETVPDGATVTVNCECFRFAAPWKGAGVAVPVLALRSARGYGIGEFADLEEFADWAAGCGMSLVQILPVNDTTSDGAWTDSYPYKGISVAALHPIYLNIERLFAEYGEPLPEDHLRRRDALNRLPELDYEAVMRDKQACLRALFGRVRDRVIADAAFHDYLRRNARWLKPYAAFCLLRDRHGTPDFTRWGDDARYAAERIDAWFAPAAAEFPEVMYHCFVQYHLEEQLGRSVRAGHAQGVAFKGDLPIGVNRCSVETWTEPELFRMDRQTGAPPDPFAELGQNWGFPTYDWPRMAEDGYAWWRRRFERMSAAFDAIRIDHVLGFFRIWEIPGGQTEGILGHYSPALPLSPEEIRRLGFEGDVAAFALPAAAPDKLERFFGDCADLAAALLLRPEADGWLRVRSEVRDPAARRARYGGRITAAAVERLEAGLRTLEFEVLFVEDPDQPGRYHPRVMLPATELFDSFPEAAQQVLKRIHDDFYFRRHDRFWEGEGLKKLPAMMDATSMLVCAEDLGMIPDCVPGALKRLGLLTLEIQRMPKKEGVSFADPGQYPHMSVCTTSTHDMETLRGWWEADAAGRLKFFREVMDGAGAPPADCTTEICRFVVRQHLDSASMWCILPLQDWLALDARLRRPDAAAERINVPANPRHYWRYRMHLTIEQLRAADAFNRNVAELIRAAGRGANDPESPNPERGRP